MVVKNQVDEIVRCLLSLPPEKIAAVKDYVDFLNAQYGKNGTVDESDEWTEEDMRDFATASARYGETVAPWDDTQVRASEGPHPGSQ